MQDVLRDLFDLDYSEGRMQLLMLLLGSSLDGYVKGTRYKYTYTSG